jgi:hypothetical protein
MQYTFTLHEDAWLRDGSVYAGGQVIRLPGRRNARREDGETCQLRGTEPERLAHYAN